MTRDEDAIIEAKKYYRNDIKCYDAFLHGVEWVEEQIANVWHDASEEPKEGMDILFISKNGKVNKVPKIDQTLYDWIKDNDGIDKWAYISDLLPKGSEK